MLRTNTYITLLMGLFLLGSTAFSLQAQEEEIKHNPLSLYPVPRERIMFKSTIWRRIDMKEKQNQPLFSREREISTIIIQAVKNNLLTPYTNDSVTTPMKKSNFLETLKYPDEGGGLTEEEKALGFTDDVNDAWGDEEDSDAGVPEGAEEYAPRDFDIVEIKEDYFFDKLRSRMYHDIIAVTIILPADKNPASFEKPLASFRFVDLAKLFRSMPEEAIWFNTKNPARHLNMVDAFLLRLFRGSITKIANPNDDAIVDIVNSRRSAAIASQQAEHQLVDFETQLWEY